MDKIERMSLLNDLVEEITKDHYDSSKVIRLVDQLGIKYSDDPMQLLNNVLKGIHFERPKNESNI